MEVFEIAGYPLGIERSGVNFLDPAYAFSEIVNGYVYRQVLQSRKGFSRFANRLSDGSRVMGIFEFVLRSGDKDLLVISKEYLYKWNTGTNAFDQVPMNSAVAIGTFSISSNNEYVSGTGYPTKTGSDRFIFTGSGMSDVYFYDGVDVKRFTNTTDNPDYAPPSSGALNKSKYVFYFGERLNFLSPTIANLLQPQTVLYSGIRNSAGNGDKFNVAGSGTSIADSYEYMTGAIIPGDYMLINFNRSSWTLEKTRDAFNPYFFRKIPGVLGTDASFSTVGWNNQSESIGKTGVLLTDGRSSLRSDNKIPYLTSNDITQTNFDLVYGGFDRENEQFIYSYPSIESGDTTEATGTQDKVLVHNYKEETWSINTQRFSVFGQTDKGQDLVWSDIYEANDESWLRWDTTEQVWNKIGLGEAVQKTLAGDNLGFVYQLNQDNDDYFVNVTNITAASSAVATVSACAIQVGDVVVLENVEGMTEINGINANVTAIGLTSGATTSITVNIDSSGFTAYATAGSVSKVIQFSATLSTFNPYRDQGRKIWVSHIEFLIDTGSGSLDVSIIEDEEEYPFKTTTLTPSVLTTASKQWITMTVNQESNFITISMEEASVSSSMNITSIRIHAAQGGFTSA